MFTVLSPPVSYLPEIIRLREKPPYNPLTWNSFSPLLCASRSNMLPSVAFSRGLVKAICQAVTPVTLPFADSPQGIHGGRLLSDPEPNFFLGPARKKIRFLAGFCR